MFKELTRKEKAKLVIVFALFIVASVSGSVLLINLVCRPGITEHIGVIVKSGLIFMVSAPLYCKLYNKWAA